MTDDLINRKIAYAMLSEYYHHKTDQQHKALWDALSRVPSAQSEIIRCKDCKHRDAEEGFCEGRGWPMQLVPDYGFCDKGERENGLQT